MNTIYQSQIVTDPSVPIYVHPDCSLHDNKVAAPWEARGGAVAERGEGESKQTNYRVVINVELSDDGYWVYCDDEDGDNLGERLCDAFDETGIDGYTFLDNFANEALWADDPQVAQDIFADRTRVIQYLKAGGFMGEQYDFVLKYIQAA